MPVEFVGGLFPQHQLAPRAAYASRPDLTYLRDLARAHERADFDRVLIANGGGDPLHLAAYAAAHTERLGFMLAHRPGITPPTLAARTFATLDHTTSGRIRLHAVTGHSPEPEYGDFLSDKAERYARAAEYLEVVKKAWTSEVPFDFHGRYYQIENGYSPIRPIQAPHIPISLGGTSDGAYETAVKHADLYALWAEPLADIQERITKLRRIAKAQGKDAPRVSLSVRLIIAPTEDLAWQKAHAIVAALKQSQALPGVVRRKGLSGGAERQVGLSQRSEKFDRALFMGTSSAIGFDTDSTSLVGTPDTVIASLLDYYDLGVTTFLNRGYDPLYDAVDYGRYIIPQVRAEVQRRDQRARSESPSVSAE